MKTMGILLTLLSLLPVLAISGDVQDPDHIQESGFRFPECPGTPNCVSSLAQEPGRKVDPFPIQGTSANSMNLLSDIIRSMPRAKIVFTSPERIEAEFRSILGFVDDVLFVLSPDKKMIHVRSASRKGSWDLGVNRRRVERIRARYLGTMVSRSPDVQVS